MAYQKTIIVGNLGDAPSMRYTPGGDAVANFSVAVNEKYGDKEYVTWFKVVAWRKLAETCNQYLAKGRQVLVEGRVEVESWNDKNTGEARAKLVIQAQKVKFLGGGTRDDGPPAQEYDSPPPF